MRSLSNLAPHGVSPEGAAHYTAVSRNVNTLSRGFSYRFPRRPARGRRLRGANSKRTARAIASKSLQAAESKGRHQAHPGEIALSDLQDTLEPGGEQALRIYDDQHQVAPALPFNRIEQKLLKLGHLGLIALLFLWVLLEEIFSLWLVLPDKQQAQWSRSLIDLPLMLLVLTLWPAALAMWSKLNQHEARFLPQLGITFLGI